MYPLKKLVPKIKFTQEEDDRLIEVIQRLGTRDWEGIAQEMKHRTPRQCRERWNNYLSPSITSDPWTSQEDELLDSLYDEFGSKWSKIAEYFPNRSANGIRNRYKLRQRRILKEKKKAEKLLKNNQNKNHESNKNDIKGNTDISEKSIDEILLKKNEDLYSLFEDGTDHYQIFFGTCS